MAGKAQTTGPTNRGYPPHLLARWTQGKQGRPTERESPPKRQASRDTPTTGQHLHGYSAGQRQRGGETMASSIDVVDLQCWYNSLAEATCLIKLCGDIVARNDMPALGVETIHEAGEAVEFVKCEMYDILTQNGQVVL